MGVSVPPLSGRRARLRACYGQFPHGLGLSLKLTELGLQPRQRGVTRRLRSCDGFPHLPDPFTTAPDMVPLPKLQDLTMCIAPLSLLDEHGGQEAALDLAVELVHEAFGRSGCMKQGGEEGA